jgi:hypothetical protein
MGAGGEELCNAAAAHEDFLPLKFAPSHPFTGFPLLRRAPTMRRHGQLHFTDGKKVAADV